MNETLHVLISKKGNLFKDRNKANIFTLNEFILSDDENGFFRCFKGGKLNIIAGFRQSAIVKSLPKTRSG